MTTQRLLVLDLLLTVVAAASFIGAAVAAANRRVAVGLGITALAVLASLAHVGTAAILAVRGWWFAQEKVTLTVPLLIVAGGLAVAVAGPRLVRATRVARTRRSTDDFAPSAVIALLTAGYATAAGAVVSLLFGYPAGGPTTLITVAVVATAALVSWSSLAPEPDRRRKAGAWLAAAVAVAGIGWAFLPQPLTDTGGAPVARDHHTVAISSLLGPDPAAAAAGTPVRRYTLTARMARVQLASGASVDAWTFDGTLPGPQLTATQGDLVEVTLRNADIAAGVTIHWHGYDVPAGEDGAPGVSQDAVAPGHEFVYRFLAQQAGTYWYHTHEVSDVGVRMGLYGSLVVKPRDASAATLDLTVPIHTISGSLILGNADQPQNQTVAPGTKVRLRIINTDSDTRLLALAGVDYRLTAVDGTDLNEPGTLTQSTLRLTAGGRYDLTFTMPSSPVHLLVDNDRTRVFQLTPPGAVAGDAPDTSSWPDLDLTTYGTPGEMAYSIAGHFDRRFLLVLDRRMALVRRLPRYAYTINGRADPSIPTQVVRQGDVVLMTLVNRGFDTHPWHLHGHHVLVLSRDGRPTTGSPLWMDSVEVRSGEVWQVAFRADNPGVWMNHCHNLAHVDGGMMVLLAYEGVSMPGAHGA